MSRHNLKHTIIALAVAQAFALSAHAQTAPQPMTEIVVTASKSAATDRATVAGFSEAPLMQTPASVVSIGLEQMQDLAIRSTTDAAKYDASISDSYNAVGYAEMFSIRGFDLDNASSYRKDGIPISGDTQIPLENKERIEILKGLAGLTAGVAAPGGVVNYAVKRPTGTPLRSATLEARERGTIYGAVDLGGRFGDRRFGYRFNAAGERLRSYVKGADGERKFVSGALDWQITPQALVQLDMDYQDKSQITAPGYQLLGNTELPTGVSPKTLLNAQPWTKPVETRTTNVGLRFEYQFNGDWRATLAANRHSFRRDDFTAFPAGCNFQYGFCANGDYDLYDYQSVGERKTPLGSQAMLQGKFATGPVKHELTVGASSFDRTDQLGDTLFEHVGMSNIYRNVIVNPTQASRVQGPEHKDEERAFFVQDILALSQQFKVHAGLRHVQVQRDDLVDASFTLPSLSLVYSPKQDWTIYGTAAHGMQHGGQADFSTNNPFEVLAPSRSKELEFGIKGIVNDRMTVSGALFELKRGFEFVNDANFFVRGGEQTHRGIEVAAQGHATANLKYSLSMAALHMQQEGTGQASIDGKRTTNVPAFRSTAVLDYAVTAVPCLRVNGVWQYSGKKAFDAENTVFVPDYHVFGIGSAYATRIGGVRTTIRANVDNVTDKFYWRDTTPLLGGYLFPGAPRTFKVSAQFDF